MNDGITQPMLAPMITSIASILVACFSFFLNVLYTNKEHRKKNTTYLLTNFYNPICSLLAENRELYLHFGPKTFSDYDMNKRMESGVLWESVKKKQLFQIWIL